MAHHDVLEGLESCSMMYLGKEVSWVVCADHLVVVGPLLVPQLLHPGFPEIQMLHPADSACVVDEPMSNFECN